jgi:O-methyltransferase
MNEVVRRALTRLRSVSVQPRRGPRNPASDERSVQLADRAKPISDSESGNPASDEISMRYPTYSRETHTEVIRNADYVRNAAIALAITTVQREGIAGDFAEVGVWRGNTSRLIHLLAPDRKLYLFDTFQGFPKDQLEPGLKGDARFQDTSIDLVSQTIGDLHNVEFRVGIFPETTAGLEASRFAFVLLDLDLYIPTLAGLQFFYPRLTRGGYLFVHDYNSIEANSGSYRAVVEFMADKLEQIVELPDQWGSIVFRKV